MVAAWIRWQAGADDRGLRHAVDDPLADVMARRLADAGSPHERVEVMLALDAVMPADLRIDAVFRDAVTGWLRLIEAWGAGSALTRFATA